MSDQTPKLEVLPQFSLSKGVDVHRKAVKALAIHVGIEFGHEMKVLITQQEETTFEFPDLKDKPSKAEEILWGKMCDSVIKQKEKYEANKGKVFTFILGQCEEPIMNKLESLSDYAKLEADKDVANLMKEIDKIVYSTSEKQYPMRLAASSLTDFLRMGQKDGESLDAYYNRFNDAVKRLDQTYGDNLYPKAWLSADTRVNVKADLKIEQLKEKFMTFLFMKSCNKGFQPMLKDLDQDFSWDEKGRYPSTRLNALKVLKEYEGHPTYRSIMKKANKIKADGEANLQVPGLNFLMSKKDMKKKGLCYRCGKAGHRSSDCTAEAGVAMVTTSNANGTVTTTPITNGVPELGQQGRFSFQH